MYRYEDIRAVHMEITTRCNASCPMCPRNISGGPINPNMPLAELSITDVRAMFPEYFLRQLSRLFMCGNYGDAMAASDTLAAFEYFRASNPKLWLKMFTNGSGRDAAWWARLARTIDECVFSVDGLEDTNHLYRRGTNWKLIMKAIESFIGAGGNASWEFIVFRHNEHQIGAAKALAKRLGFKKFTAKKTERFLQNGRQVDRREVLDADGRHAYDIERPRDPRYWNETLTAIDGLASGQASYDAHLNETSVDCKAVKEQQIFVSAEGLIFPCCWTGKLYDASRPNGTSELWKMVNRLPQGKDSLDARRHTIEEIISGPMFQQDIPESWVPGSAARKKLMICARTCGALDFIKSQRDAEKAPATPKSKLD